MRWEDWLNGVVKNLKRLLGVGVVVTLLWEVLPVSDNPTLVLGNPSTD